jgi:hypothetical protein
MCQCILVVHHCNAGLQLECYIDLQNVFKLSRINLTFIWKYFINVFETFRIMNTPLMRRMYLIGWICARESRSSLKLIGDLGLCSLEKMKSSEMVRGRTYIDNASLMHQPIQFEVIFCSYNTYAVFLSRRLLPINNDSEVYCIDWCCFYCVSIWKPVEMELTLNQFTAVN